MPRRFTLAELSRVTTGEYNAMSADDREAYDRALWAMWSDDSRYLAGDYDTIGSYRRYQWGE